MIWVNTPNKGRSGFVQSRLYCGSYPNLTLAEIEFHAPIFYVNITRHVKGYVDTQLNGPPKFDNITEAKDWAVAMVSLS